MRKILIAVVAGIVFTAAAIAQSDGRKRTTGQNRYVMAVSHDGTVLWRMDTTTGEASYCVPSMGEKGRFSCEKWLP